MEPRPAHLVPLYQPSPSRLAYRPREIAKLTGLSNSAVYTEIAAGRLAATRHGRAIVITIEAYQAWMRGGAREEGR